jgi:hypothetical protein
LVCDLAQIALWCLAVFVGNIHPLIWVVDITVLRLRVWW